MGLSRSRLAGAVLVLVAAIVVIVGVGLLSVPAAVILAGILLAVLGSSLVVEVRP